MFSILNFHCFFVFFHSGSVWLLYLQGVITSSCHHRMESYLPHIIPILQQFCMSRDEAINALSSQQQQFQHVLVELWECCLQAFESLILSMPNKISPHCASILAIIYQFMVYDPNYIYADDNDNIQMNVTSSATSSDDWGDDDGAGWDDVEMETDERQSSHQPTKQAKQSTSYNNDGEEDEDDTCWRVRRMAIKVLQAFLLKSNYYQDILFHSYQQIVTLLIQRLKERNINVKLALLSCFADVLQRAVITKQSLIHHDSVETQNIKVFTNLHQAANTRCSVTANELFPILQQHLPALINKVGLSHITTPIQCSSNCILLMCY